MTPRQGRAIPRAAPPTCAMDAQTSPCADNWPDIQPTSGIESAAWMSVRHAACRLDVSESTVRRWILTGRLRSRIVARGARFYHEVLVEAVPRASSSAGSPTDIVHYLQRQLTARQEELAQREQDISRQEEQIRRLSSALARALERGDGYRSPKQSPFQRYRWLARHRGWWPFR
jgi:excisionase family DNA binding protein